MKQHVGPAPQAAFPYRLCDGVQIKKENRYYIDRAWAPVGVTEQFTVDAKLYHERRIMDFLDQMDRALSLAHIDRGAPLQVLDIGSGSGGTVFATAELLRNATVVASDISPQLLDMISEVVATDERLRRTVVSCCFDLHAPFFAEKQFDLITGWAILHHLLDPVAALKNVAASLRPNGKLILNEPLESGCMLLSSMYAKVIKVLRNLGQPDDILVDLMNALRKDYRYRLGVPVQQTWTGWLDDKWLFDEPYLMDLGAQLGFNRVEVHPIQSDLTNLYEGCFRSILIETGNTNYRVPDEVFEVFREFDRELTPLLKAQFSPSGFIIFSKGE